MAITVGNDNFPRAETDRMFAGLQAQAGGVNQWFHNRGPTPVDQQTVVRMNRDTLYSMAIVDLAGGATVTVPESDGRYLSVMVVNQDHYINRIFHEPGNHSLTVGEYDTRYVCLAARVLVDASDPEDVATVNKIQDGFSLTADSGDPFVMPDYDEASFTATRDGLLDQARRGMSGTTGMFGTKDAVDHDKHLLGTAAGWGGLPENEAFYVSVEPHLPVGTYRITVKDVPVDAFWSITLYNADGFMQQNAQDAYSVNSVSGVKNDDGSITVHLGGEDDRPNNLPIMDGWNYLIRLYQPRPEVLNGTWTFPAHEPAT